MGLCHGKPVESPLPREELEDPVVSSNGIPPPNPGTPKPQNRHSTVRAHCGRHFDAIAEDLQARRHSVPPPIGPPSAKQFLSRYELGEEVGRGHFGYTCCAKAIKGELKGHEVAVKVILKSKMTTAVAIEDVRREVRILRALAGHKNLVQFYEAYEDDNGVYIVMELCKGGELLDRILARGGKYSEEDAKGVMVQILNVVSFCHLQGVVIDFGLSDFVKPDERLNDIVGSAYYVAPEVLRRSYGTEADMWASARPFWARTESGIFRTVLKADPNFEEPPWPTLSSEAKDFVKRLLNKDYRKRMTAAQALCHPWIRDHEDATIPMDMQICRLMRAYICSSSLRKSALVALAKSLTVNQLFYLREQFTLLGPNKNGYIALQNLKTVLLKHSTDAVKDSRVLDFVNAVCSLQYRKLDFKEFAAAAVSVHQLEASANWEQLARSAYELFDKEGNRPIMIEELASELGLSPSVPMHVVLQDWIRHSDGKLSFVGFVKLLHGASSRSMPKA
ncbi:unnamed protein product [Spirodela intermedia]|uniref:Protein kinase domain-containing protein n=1 Tax=Spirodela intermedia TaxID=51605 RepID=A0A7I8IGW7_SPIIN|nr:unnamed protein product [Spirodela intermedia]CAA6657031.1 unnamed protein product [Spirodela intermedia]